ncbi:MAG: cytosine permease [Actinomycetota bacterium]|nr:cytosine permease [Actinomycetota bacterium]
MTATIDRAATTRVEAPPTLAEAPPRPLGLLDQGSLWGNLGISLTLPVAAAFVLEPAGVPRLSIVAALVAVVVGSILGSAVLGLSAVPGAQTGAPAMVLLRGLFGLRGSYLPTVLNLLQCVGWATVEVVVIAESADRLTPGHLRWLFVLLAGALATGLALRPLGMVRVLRRYAVWVVLAATAYLFVQVLRSPLPSLTAGSWQGFWPAADTVIAIAVSWAPLAADYSRHSRTGAAAFTGAFAGFATASVVYFALGVFALATIVGKDGDVLGALLAVPVGGLALGILVLDELDEAFANVYSAAVSTQNLRPLLDRRVLAVGVGLLSVALGLVVHITDYQAFLYLLGAVFLPLFATLLVDYFLLRRGHWDVSESAPRRWLMALPWLAGFMAYQLVNPGSISWWVTGWTTVRGWLHLTPAPWLSASIVSFTVAAVLAAVVGILSGLPRLRARSAAARTR